MTPMRSEILEKMLVAGAFLASSSCVVVWVVFGAVGINMQATAQCFAESQSQHMCI